MNVDADDVINELRAMLSDSQYDVALLRAANKVLNAEIDKLKEDPAH